MMISHLAQCCTALLGLQLKTKPINVVLKDMIFIQYWELDVHITTVHMKQQMFENLMRTYTHAYLHAHTYTCLRALAVPTHVPNQSLPMHILPHNSFLHVPYAYIQVSSHFYQL